MEITLSVDVLADISDKRLLIETGSFIGDGTQVALDAGYEHVISIENDESRYNICVDRFRRDTRVTNLFGDSEIVLPKILDILKYPVTFWLDAHVIGRSTTAMLHELREIAIRDIDNHSILIDDMRVIRGGTSYGESITIAQLEAAVREINPDYEISYVANVIDPRDILKAVIR
jgi:hypothetical protein